MSLRLVVLGLLACCLVPAAAGDPGKPPPQTSVTSGPPPLGNARSATFTFSSNREKARFGCALDTGAFFNCASPMTLSVRDGTHHFYVIAIEDDRVDPTPAVWTWAVDTTPPAPLRGRASVSYRRLVLSWGAVGAAGAQEVAILRTTRPKREPTSEVYRGSGSSYVEGSYINGLFHRYRLIASDRAGNSSAPVDIVVSASALLLSPKDGATVQGPPALRWRAVPRASFYNAQLFRGGKKLLSVWPRTPKLKLKRGWSYLGKHHTLKPGRYTWYIWPGFGPFAHSRYGGLVGQGTFAVAPSRRGR